MQTTYPRIIYEGFTNGSGPFLKKYSIMRKDLDCELFYSNQNVTTSHIIFTYLATDIIHTLENEQYRVNKRT